MHQFAKAAIANFSISDQRRKDLKQRLNLRLKIGHRRLKIPQLYPQINRLSWRLLILAIRGCLRKWRSLMEKEIAFLVGSQQRGDRLAAQLLVPENIIIQQRSSGKYQIISQNVLDIEQSIRRLSPEEQQWLNESLLDFQREIAQRGICIHYDVEEFEADIQTWQKMGRI